MRCRVGTRDAGAIITMNKNVQFFNHPVFGNIRTIVAEDGSVQFGGSDVARALGYTNLQKAIRDHVDAEDKGVNETVTPGGRQQMVVINESGLYALILGSKLPNARVFKRWVTSEVLPQIRQTGGYIPTRNMRTGEALPAEEVVQKAMGIMQKTISRENLPADDCVSTRQIAELYGMDVKDLYSFLCDKGIVKRVNGRYHLTPRHAGKGYDGTRVYHGFSLDGRPKVRPYLVWTQAGAAFISEVVKGLMFNV